ncbi:MAG: LysR family transcriptional regulator [Tissierellia bacterium]|nr:LysR family transcriptional regulator [Tissierellia bacterium]
MDIEYIREFVILSEELNYTRTAEKLFINQSALSRHIAKIEEIVGAKLLVRTTHNVALTEIGVKTYENFKKIITDYDHAIKNVELYTKGLTGTIRLGLLYYHVEIYAKNILKKMKEGYPSIEVSFSSYQPKEMLESLENKTIDIAIYWNLPKIRPPFVEYQPLNEEKLVVVLSNAHPLANVEEIMPADLSNNTFIMIKDSEISKYAKNLLESRGVKIDHCAICENIDLLHLTVNETNGFAIVPAAIHYMQREDIIYKEINDPSFKVNTCFIYRGDHNNAALPEFLRLMSSIKF